MSSQRGGMQVVRMVQPDGQLHTDVYCPKCGTEMLELEIESKDMGEFILWETYRKCQNCGTKVEKK